MSSPGPTATLVLLSALPLAADTGAPVPAKDLDKVVGEIHFVETSRPGIVLSGLVDTGYIYNFTGSDSTIASRGLTSDGEHGGDFSLNQIRLTLEKSLTEANEFQAGFRVDFMWGEDANDFGAQAVSPANTDLEGFYFQQAFVQARLPWGNGLDIVAGRWGALLGYEADERADNLNITQGVNALIDPAPNMGVVFFYPFSDTLDAGLAVSNSGGRPDNVGLDQDDDGYAVTGCLLGSNPAGNFEWHAAFHFAPWGDPQYGTENEPLAVFNAWAQWAPLCCDKRLALAVNSSFGTFNDLAAPEDLTTPALEALDDASTLWVVAAYAHYHFTDIVSLAVRGEYLHACDDQVFYGAGTFGSSDLYTCTCTLGFQLFEDLMVRIEYRADLGADVQQDAAGASTANSAHTLATQIVYRF